MASERSARDADGVTATPSGRAWRKRAWLACAAAICAAVVALVAIPRGGDESVARAGDVAVGSPPGETAEAPNRSQQTRQQDAGTEPASPPSAPERKPQQVGGPEQEAAVPSGIGLFPPPGTDPIKIGLVVPDDFPLPEGYLRHYQVTDDGQPMSAILMFHPDYELLDERGQPVPLPADRVVPPELAPPGLAVELLVPPRPRAEEGAP